VIVRFLSSRSISARGLRRLLNIWPPFIGAGIRVMDIAPDFLSARVRLRLGVLNRNAFGTHFGGSLFAMTDPFFALMVLHHLGPDYIVWDRAASIEYVAPGRGRVYAEFVLPQERLDEIARATAGGERYEPRFSVDVKDEAGDTIARVERVIYVRRKRAKGAPQQQEQTQARTEVAAQ
jgi:acyl-coenzyme A thioesterase PaaI-like protein